ncbi:MAG: TPM domain-containing protein [Lachnospiraceae bacterium]|nr:TPM domain-containing protein [Lachnospiraceae bacterium]
MKRFKTFAAFAFALVCLGTTGLKAEAASASAEAYVADYAEILSDDTKNYVMSVSMSLGDACDTEIAIYTLNTLNGHSSEEFAADVFEVWAMSSDNSDKGILIIMATEDENYLIVPGANAGDLLPADAIKDITDAHLIKNAKNGDFDLAATETTAEIAKYVADKKGVTVDTSGNYVSAPNEQTEANASEGISTKEFVIRMAAASVFLIASLIIIFTRQQPRGGSYTDFKRRPKGPKKK